MPSSIAQYVLRLAMDPAEAQRFRQDGRGAAGAAGLSQQHIDLLMSADHQAITAAMQSEFAANAANNTTATVPITLPRGG